MLLHFVSGALIISLAGEGNFFNDLFKMRHTPFQNNSFLLSFAFKTDKHMTTLNISEKNIYKIIKFLSLNKSHCWGGISQKFIYLSGKSISRFFLKAYL